MKFWILEYISATKGSSTHNILPVGLSCSDKTYQVKPSL